MRSSHRADLHPDRATSTTDTTSPRILDILLGVEASPVYYTRLAASWVAPATLDSVLRTLGRRSGSRCGAHTSFRFCCWWALCCGPPRLRPQPTLIRPVPAAIRKSSTAIRKLPMAQASGLAVDGLLPGEFTHAASGVRYRLFLRDGRAWLSYERPNASPQQALKGEQELSYFVGSGQRGRTYLFQKNGYWFESPVNWYSKQRVWDMNPKSIDAREMPFTLKVDRGCLHCHSTGVQPVRGANNHFGPQPFLYGGITCQSCHGDPAAHLASGGAAAILNPAKLSPSKRDSVCLQCHLEGETAVNATGTLPRCFRARRESFRLCNSFRSFRRVGP